MRIRGRKITVIVNWRDSDNPAAGGAELYCEEVARRLGATGRVVVLLTAKVPDLPSIERRDGYRVVRRGSRLGVYPAALAWLWVHRRRIDGVIDSQNGIPFFSPLAVGSKVPVLLLIHHVHQDQFGTYFSPVAARIGRWLEGPATRWVYGTRAAVAVSPSTRQAMRLRLRLAGPIAIASPGCEPPTSPGRLPGARSATPRLVWVGRMVRHKRAHLAIDAMPAVLAHHPDAELHLIGDGLERARLEEQAAKMAPGRVIFHGALPDDERDAVVRSSWVGVNCSMGEGWGISVIEANGLGVPVVGLRVPGLRDSIRDGVTGWLVDEPADLGLRLAGVLEMLSDAEVASEWSDRSVEWAARAQWSETARVLDDLLKSERGRLSRGDRRQPTDLAIQVFLPTGLLPPDWTPTFRLTDRPVLHSSGLSILLFGADLNDVATALRRAGLPPGITRDPRLQTRIARPADLVDPAAADRDRVVPRDAAPVAPVEILAPELSVASVDIEVDAAQ